MVGDEALHAYGSEFYVNQRHLALSELQSHTDSQTSQRMACGHPEGLLPPTHLNTNFELIQRRHHTTLEHSDQFHHSNLHQTGFPLLSFNN
jgi:hypothetical protein